MRDAIIKFLNNDTLMSAAIGVGGTLVAAVIGSILVIQAQRKADRARDTREAEDRAEGRRVRLWLFADEAVYLHRRWVLYATQACTSLYGADPNRMIGVSASRPYEWVEAPSIEQYIRVGGSSAAVHALTRVKELNAQVTRQLERVQSGDPTGLLLILGFVFSSDNWAPVAEEIRILIRHVRDAGGDTRELQQRFDQHFAAGEEVRRVVEAHENPAPTRGSSDRTAQSAPTT